MAISESMGELPALKILLVEDNQINQELVLDFLENTPCQVILAHDGHAAVECFYKQRFDVVLMDCHMPSMDGFQATRVFRELEKNFSWRRTPIVAVTAHALKHDRGQCLAAGMDDYLSKPFSRAELLDKLQAWGLPPV